MNRIVTGIAGVLALAVVLLWWRYDAALEDLARAEAGQASAVEANRTTNASINSLRSQLEQCVMRGIKEREQREETLSQLRDTLAEQKARADEIERERREALEHDEAYKAWVGNPAPSSVFSRLRKRAGRGDENPDGNGESTGVRSNSAGPGGNDRAAPDP